MFSAKSIEKKVTKRPQNDSFPVVVLKLATYIISSSVNDQYEEKSSKLNKSIILNYFLFFFLLELKREV